MRGSCSWGVQPACFKDQLLLGSFRQGAQDLWNLMYDLAQGLGWESDPRSYFLEQKPHIDVWRVRGSLYLVL